MFASALLEKSKTSAQYSVERVEAVTAAFISFLEPMTKPARSRLETALQPVLVSIEQNRLRPARRSR